MCGDVASKFSIEPALIEGVKSFTDDEADSEGDQAADSVEPEMISSDDDAEQCERRIQQHGCS